MPFSLCSTASADRCWDNGITADTWSSSTDWSVTSPIGPGGASVPGSADNAYITNTDALNEVVTLDKNDTILSLNIGNTGGGTDILSQTSAFNLSAGTETVGVGTSSVGVHSQSAGTNTYSGSLILGSGTSSVGTYNLSGTGSIDSTGYGTLGIYVGYNGSGTFNQSGGSSRTQNLFVAAEPGSSGNYLLSGNGSLTVYQYASVGGIKQQRRRLWNTRGQRRLNRCGRQLDRLPHRHLAALGWVNIGGHPVCRW